MTETPSNCRTVTTQAELDDALAAKQANDAVCIHVHGAAEESVLAWELANRVERPIEGDWGPSK